jgi:hypothetical protein
MAVYKNQSYPILNDVFGWLARYGLLFMATGAWLLFGLIKRAMTVLKSLGQLNNPEHIVFYRIVIKAFFCHNSSYFNSGSSNTCQRDIMANFINAIFLLASYSFSRR